MSNLNLNTIAASLAFPFEAGNAIFVHEACNCNTSVFVKVHIQDILSLERQHDCPVTSIHLMGGGTVDADAISVTTLERTSVHAWPSVRRRDGIPESLTTTTLTALFTTGIPKSSPKSSTVVLSDAITSPNSTNW